MTQKLITAAQINAGSSLGQIAVHDGALDADTLNGKAASAFALLSSLTTQVLTGGTATTIQTVAISSGVLTINANLSNVFYVSQNQNITSMSVTNPTDGQTIFVIFNQATGGNTTVFPVNFSFIGNSITDPGNGTESLLQATYSTTLTGWTCTLVAASQITHGTVTSVAATGSTGLVIGGSPVTTTGTLTFTLGAELQGLSGLATTGFVQRTGAGTYSVANLTSGQITTALGYTPGTGNGTVTSVSVTTANGVSGSVATSTTTPAITLTLGAITPTSVAATGTVTGSNLSGTNTGNQTITLTGDVTGSGTGSFAATLATVNTVTPGTFGDATHVPTITVNGKGLTTASSSTAITFPVTSVFTRTGAVVAAANDYSFSQISGSVAATQMPALTGDITTVAGAVATTLATVNANIGTFGSASQVGTFTVNGKGLITAASNVSITAAAGTLTGSALNATVVTSSLTSVGTITAGVWNGTVISASKGGTGQTAYTINDILYASSTSALSTLGIGASGTVLTSNGATLAPSWVTLSGVSVTSITGTANQIVASSSTGAITLSLSQNLVVPTPASGIALTVNAVSGSSGLRVNGATTDAARISLVDGNTGNQQYQFRVGAIATGTFDIFDATAVASCLQINSTGNFTIIAPSSGTALTLNATSSSVGAINLASGLLLLAGAAGTAGQVLSSGGPTAVPTWASVPTSIAGTVNQITASASTGVVTLSLPSTINVNTSGTATNATNTTITDNAGVSSATWYPTFVSAGSGNLPHTVDATVNPLTYVPSTGTLGANALTINNNITRTGGQSTAYWLTADGSGRQHWYWNTTGGGSPTFLVGNEDAMDIMMTSNTGQGWVGSATFATTVMTVTATTSGTLAVGNLITGSGVAASTYVVSLGTYNGTSGTGTVNVNTTNTIGSAVIVTGFPTNATFDATISSTTLTVVTLRSGTIQAGLFVGGTGVSAGTYIVSGSGSTWTVSVSQTVASSTLMAGVSGPSFVMRGAGGGNRVAGNALTFTQLLNLTSTGSTITTASLAVSGSLSASSFTGSGSGLTGIVTSITGTANQIAASASTGAVTLSLPQNVIIPTPSSGVALTVNGNTTGNIVTIKNAQDSAVAFLVAGVTKGIRFETGTGGSAIDGVDQTGTGSFQPLTIQGSTLALTVAGVTALGIGAAGNVSIGAPTSGTTLTIGALVNGVGLTVNGNTAINGATNTAFANSLVVAPTFNSGATSRADTIIVAPNTAAGSYTLPSVDCFEAQWNSTGAGSAITSLVGYRADPSLAGVATNGFGFQSNLAAGSSQWNFYAGGTAANFFQGQTTIGAPSSGTALTVSGSGGAAVTTVPTVVATQNSTNLWMLPSISPGSYNGLTVSGDSAIVAGGTSAVGTGVLTLTAWSNTNVGIRISGVANTVAIAGATTIAAPATGQALTVNGASNAYAGVFVGGSTTGQSYGLLTQAGTNGSDYALNVQNHSNASMLTVNGLGNVTISAPTSGTTLSVTAQGLGTGFLVGSTGNTTNGTISIAFDVNGNQYLQGLTASTTFNVGSFQAGTALALVTAGSTRVQINSTGAVVVNTPSSGVALKAIGIGSSSSQAFIAQATVGTAPANTDIGEIMCITNNSTTGDNRLITFGQVGANAFIRPVQQGAGPAAAGLLISTQNGGTTFASTGTVTIAVPSSGVHTINGNTVLNAQDNVTSVSAAGVTTTINCQTQNVESITLGAGANTITFSNTPGSNTSQTITIVLVQDATGSRVLPTFSQTIRWDNGLTPVLTTTASKTDIIQIMIVNISGTTTYYGAQVMGNV